MLHLVIKVFCLSFWPNDILLVVLGKGFKDEHQMELWTLILFSLREVEMFLQHCYIDAEKEHFSYKLSLSTAPS